MNSKKLYFTLLGCLTLLGIAIIAGVFEANTLLQKQAGNLAAKKALSSALDAEQIQLAKDKKDILSYSDLNTVAKTIVPQDKDQAEAIRQIVKIAEENNVPRLSSVTFLASTLGGTGTSSGASGSSAKNTLTQLTPVKGISGVYTLPITVTVTQADAVPFSSFIKFLHGLEQNRRTAQVSSISITPTSANPNNVAFNLIIDEYIKP